MARLSALQNDFNILPQLDAANVARIEGRLGVVRDWGAGALKKLRRGKNASPEIHTVLAVGGFYNPRKRVLQPRDTALLKTAFAWARKIGFTVDPNPDIRILNLYDGFDYLDPKRFYAADVVAICYVAKYGFTMDGIPDILKRDYGDKVSPFGNNNIVPWKERLEAGNPLFAVSAEHTIHRDEVTVSAARPETYVELQNPPVFRAKDYHPEIWDRAPKKSDYTVHGIVRNDVLARLRVPAP
jgi:hypothetical protein